MSSCDPRIGELWVFQGVQVVRVTGFVEVSGIPMVLVLCFDDATGFSEHLLDRSRFWVGELQPALRPLEVYRAE